MLDTSTKKRIDDCRDILVGKLPDPKAQIEQITIGLIYKFMDDIDKEAVELGGQSKFFADYKVSDPKFPNDRNKDKIVEFSKYAWDNLLNSKVTASEMLTLYSAAIVGMDKNPNIPQLFRDIFKNAYLPYRDPETLKLFLKTIGEFEYSHSEKLGDAFEYLLSVMGSQGDAGQFRTPRHIIDFIVAIVDPEKNETILDPACGTAGFLISAFKHIKEKNNNELTPDERKKLIQNFVGYDISPDMVRLSLVNLYLHGFSDPHIYEYDTLSSEERWTESFDVILANPPFMSPKGGIRPHKKFTVSSNRSEVLFVDYIAEHLNPKGKAGIIVPEGVIFQSGTAYKDLRKMLVDHYLYAVVSLPVGVFNPYSGVKTSILLMDNEVTKRRNEILFVKIDNDGYNLGAQRTAIKGSQLKEAVELIHEFVKTGELKESLFAHLVPKTKIIQNSEYNLSGERYKTQVLLDSNYDIVPLGEVMELNFGERITKKENTGTIYPVYGGGGESFRTDNCNRENEFVISRFAMAEKCVRYVSGKFWMMDSGGTISIREKYDRKLSKRYLGLLLTSNQELVYNCARGGAQKNLKNEQFYEIRIPIPPLSIQEDIVAEIEGYQKIINGAKAVIDNYKPKIEIDPEWEMLELGQLCDVKAGGTPLRSKKEFWEGIIPWYSSGELNANYTEDSKEFITTKGLKGSNATLFPKGSLLIGMYDTAAFKMSILDREATFNQAVCGVKPNKDVDLYFLMLFFIMNKDEYLRHRVGVRQRNLNKGFISEIKVPKISLNTQHKIVFQIEKEQKLVNANKQLIEIFEQKIKDRIAKVWKS